MPGTPGKSAEELLWTLRGSQTYQQARAASAEYQPNALRCILQPLGSPSSAKWRMLPSVNVKNQSLPRTSLDSSPGEKSPLICGARLGLSSAGKSTKDFRYGGCKSGSWVPFMPI